MTKARLIKQSEILQRNETQATQAAMKTEGQAADSRNVTAVVQTWMRQLQAIQPRNPRKAFAALFVQTQTA